VRRIIIAGSVVEDPTQSMNLNRDIGQLHSLVVGKRCRMVALFAVLLPTHKAILLFFNG
jgi:hypothetical protein